VSILSKIWNKQSSVQKKTEAVYKEYLPTIRRRCRKILREEHLVEDALQEIFSIIFRYIEQYRGVPEDILPWLYKITMTQCLQVLEKEKRWFAPLQAALEEGHQSFSNQLGPSSVEEHMAALQLMEHLPQQQREVLLHRHVSGMTQEEIAEVMGITRNQVRLYLSIASEKGKRLLNEKG
tara:strand:- start:9700 stop:10236 length:537 start_codon:yes stop_codon:yes gene_type:complete